jgi:hypothetical protein
MRTVDLRSVDSASNILSGYEISANGYDSSAASVILSLSRLLSLAFAAASRGVSFYSTSPVSFLALEHVFPASYLNREEETLRPPIRTVKWSRFSVCLSAAMGRCVGSLFQGSLTFLQQPGKQSCACFLAQSEHSQRLSQTLARFQGGR